MASVPTLFSIGPLRVSPLDLLLVFVPVTIVLEVAHAPAVWIFASSCVSIIPLAGWMGRATEHLSSHFGAGVGGLLNATFGNAAEMIIATFALFKGLDEIVKASITGSIIGNILLVLGLSLLLGGFKNQRQTFNRTAAGVGSTLLALSAIGLVVPAVFWELGGAAELEREQSVSLDIAIVLFVVYIASLLFSLKTHRHLFAGEEGDSIADAEEPSWSKGKALAALLIATAFVALMSEMLVGSVEHTAEVWGMTEVFVGVILVAIVGNAAEHSTAVLVAMKNKMDLSINIAVGSSIQIALFVAPMLVFLSYARPGDLGPLDLHFSPFEVVAVVASVAVVALVAHDGESHWMEGLMLLAVYVILGIAFFYLPV